METNGGGYTFVDSKFFDKLTEDEEVQLQFKANDALVYFLNNQGVQTYGVMSQLENYRLKWL